MANKKLTFNMIAADMPKPEVTAIRFGTDDKYEIQVRHQLPFAEAMAFVEAIFRACIDNDGAVHPELFDFAVRANTLIMYAGISGFDEKHADKAYRVAYWGDLYDKVRKAVDSEQYADLITAAQLRLDDYAASMNSANTMRINDLMAKMDDMMNISQQTMAEFNSEEFQEKLRQAMGSAGEEVNRLDTL